MQSEGHPRRSGKLNDIIQYFFIVGFDHCFALVRCASHVDNLGNSLRSGCHGETAQTLRSHKDGSKTTSQKEVTKNFYDQKEAKEEKKKKQ